MEVSRRKLIKVAVGSAATSAIVTSVRSALANEDESNGGPEGSVYYTEAKPGRWKKKVRTHVPVITSERTEQGVKIKVITAHEMKGFEHYIIKHVLLDNNYNVMAENLFNPVKQLQPKSIFELSGLAYTGTVYAVSLCNLHDAWLTSASV